MRRLSFVLLLLGSAACSGRAAPDAAPATIPDAPVAAEAPPDTVVTTDAPATAVAPVGGSVLVASAQSVWLAGVDGSLGALAVDGASIAPKWIARRQDGSAIVVTDHALYEGDANGLFPSPASSALASKTLLAVDARGQGDDEDVWVLAEEGAFLLRGGALTPFTVGDAPKRLDAIVGVGSQRALVAGGGRVWLVDLAKPAVEDVAADLGAAHGWDRSEDGTVYLATDAGLWARQSDGSQALYTFSGTGTKSPGASAVSAAYGAVLAVTGGTLAAIDGSGIHALAAVSGVPAQGIATDANGNTWFVSAGALHHARTGAPVSFAADVAPFFHAHCATCHASPASGAPQRDFESLETARSYADTIVRRLTSADGSSPMPPASAERLSPADYGPVLRWVASGMAP
jgi:mono/diheme cytochrome c family protein